MDAVEILNEDFLSCSICTEVFKDPCTIGCGHTFCKKCLTQFIKSRLDVITAKSILCPMCRQMTKVPNSSKPVEAWYNQFKPSFLMQGLLDKFAVPECAIGENGEVCSSCDQVGQRARATSWCKTCDRMLCTNCAQTHHTLPGMSAHIISSHNAKGEVIQKQRSVCIEHNTIIEFCCRDCNKAVCHKCCIVYHRKCDSVVTMDSMVPEMISVILINKEMVQSNMNATKSIINQEKSQMKTFSQTKREAEATIRKASQRATDLIKLKEKQLMGELSDIAKKQTEQLMRDTTSRERDLQICQQHSEFMNKALRSGNTMDMYDMFQLCQSGAMTVDVKTETLSQQPFRKLMFVDESKFIRHVSLGNVFVSAGDTVQVYKTTLKSMASTRTVNDKEKSDPNDIVVLIVDGMETIVITDYNNNSVKSFLRKNWSNCSSQTFHHKPVGLAKVSDVKIVISFQTNTFIVASVNPRIVIEKRVTTRKIYDHITALNCPVLAAICRNMIYDEDGYNEYRTNPCIDIIDLAGNVLRTVAVEEDTLLYIDQPGGIWISNKGHILITDRWSGSVLCLTAVGKLIFKYTPTGDRSLTGPRGVTTTKRGDILIADFYISSVVQLTETGEYVRDILTSVDVDLPQGPKQNCLDIQVMTRSEFEPPHRSMRHTTGKCTPAIVSSYVALFFK